MKKTKSNDWSVFSLVKGTIAAITGAAIDRLKKDEKNVDPDVQRGRMFIDIAKRMENIW